MRRCEREGGREGERERERVQSKRREYGARLMKGKIPGENAPEEARQMETET